MIRCHSPIDALFSPDHSRRQSNLLLFRDANVFIDTMIPPSRQRPSISVQCNNTGLRFSPFSHSSRGCDVGERCEKLKLEDAGPPYVTIQQHPSHIPASSLALPSRCSLSASLLLGNTFLSASSASRSFVVFIRVRWTDEEGDNRVRILAAVPRRESKRSFPSP